MNEDATYERMSTQATSAEVEAYRALVELFQSTPIPPGEILANLSLYLTRSALSQLLFMRDLYAKITDVHGSVMEFGSRWGRNLALFTSLRNVLEPHNYGRRIVGFDTYQGFASVSPEDGSNPVMTVGALSVPVGYQRYLNEVLAIHERLSPRPGLRRFETISGDIEQTLPAYLESHPETIVALAYFDMDLYRPTRAALHSLTPYLAKGSVIGFDELCVPEFPGETKALREVLDISSRAIVRSHYSSHQSYIVW